MKRLVSAALVGVMAIGAVAASAATASADPYHYRYHHYGYHDDGAGFVAAGILGLATGLVASQVLSPEPPPPLPYPAYAAGYGPVDAHVQWCESTYRSYDPETDLWRDFQGVAHRCAGPY
jgi:hypothetical protein